MPPTFPTAAVDVPHRAAFARNLHSYRGDQGCGCVGILRTRGLLLPVPRRSLAGPHDARRPHLHGSESAVHIVQSNLKREG